MKLKPCPCSGREIPVLAPPGGGGWGAGAHKPQAEARSCCCDKALWDADMPSSTSVYATAAHRGIRRAERLRQTPCGSEASSIHCLAFYRKHLLITAGDRHWLLCARTHAKEPTEVLCTTAKGWRTLSAHQ